MEDTQYDVAVVGAGFAGSCIALALGARGIRTLLLDRQANYPEAFRAEKIEPDQASIMTRNNWLGYRSPCFPPIGETLKFKREQLRSHETVEQYGIQYTDTVNSLRTQAASLVEFRVATVTAVRNSAQLQVLELGDAPPVSCRLVVIATGMSTALLQPLGFELKTDSSLQSLSFGFYLEPGAAAGFAFRGFDYFPDPRATGVDFLTLFPIGQRMRANLFSQLPVRSDLAKSLRTNTAGTLDALFPELRRHIGEYTISSPTQFFATEFYRVGNPARAGVVLAGDAYQSVSPTTGTGLSKVLTDADLLGNIYVPRWLEHGSADAGAINTYYRDPRKRATDNESLHRWIHYRDLKRGFWGNQLSKIQLRWSALVDGR